MQRFSIRLLLVLSMSLAALASCAKPDQVPASTDARDMPHATVTMRDGSRISGTVSSSTPAEITLNMDGGGSRTVSMKEVKSVDYGDAAAARGASAPKAAETDTHEN